MQTVWNARGHARALARMAAALVVSLAAAGWAQAATPDLNGGTWLPSLRTVQTIAQLRGGRLPPLRAEARKAYASHLAELKAGRRGFDTMARCNAPGVPRLLLQPMAFEFLQRDDRLFIHYQWNRLVRVVEMGIAQPEIPGPQLLGQSVGRFDGSDLVIDTIGQSDQTLLDGTGLPHGDGLHVVERYRLEQGGKVLRAHVRVEDEATYEHPWEFTLAWRHDAHGRIAEDVCVEREGVVFYRKGK